LETSMARSNQIAILKDVDLRPDMASIDGDRAVIEQTATYVKGLWSQMKTAEVYIAAGREFKNAHDHLSKNSRHDRNRIGWVKAFGKAENKFDCGRTTAEKYIAIFEGFFHVANMEIAAILWRAICSCQSQAKH